MTELVISGHIPSKKNLLKVTASGRGYYDKEIREQLNDLSEQIATQWKVTDVEGVKHPRAPLVHPAMAVVFYVTTGRSDNDNRWTTVLDALVSGGVLKDDCVEQCNGPVLICSSVRTTTVAGAKVFIQEDGDLARLYRHVCSYNFEDYKWLKDARTERGKVKARRMRKI